jgi:carbamoyl-phosphate synthase large subunit
MNRTSAIMVTAVGGLIGQGILRSLRQVQCAHRLVGLDRSHNAYGASLCDASFRKPCAETDAAYLPWLRELMAREQVRLVLPGIEEDVFFFHDHRAAMSDWPAQIALNSPAAIEAGRDKWLLHEDLLRHQLPAIPTTMPADWSGLCAALGEPPFIAKARRGSGSRGQRILHDESEWQRQRHLLGEGFLIQKLVGSDAEEYTVGLFGYGDGQSSELFVLHRRLWSGGTWQAETVAPDDALTSFCAALTRVFKPIGPTNYQFRRAGDNWHLLEINPRISAATAIRAGFGFNDAMLCVEHYLCGQPRPRPGTLRQGRCQRYVTELFEFA